MGETTLMVPKHNPTIGMMVNSKKNHAIQDYSDDLSQIASPRSKSIRKSLGENSMLKKSLLNPDVDESSSFAVAPSHGNTPVSCSTQGGPPLKHAKTFLPP